MKPQVQVSESVGSGHPDKLADMMADLILEKLLDININAHLACEVMAAKNLIVVAGEMSGANVEDLKIKFIVESVLSSFGYEVEEFNIVVDIKEQSKDIVISSWGSSTGIVSGDQSSVIGYAISETDNYLPLSYEIARSLTQKIEDCIVDGLIKGAKYDCKSLVVLKESEIQELFFSIQHEEDVDVNEFREEIYKKVIVDILNKFHVKFRKDAIKINSSNRFVIGGLYADTGVTNRKLIVDSYGTISRHGGGGYSGKDLTKVDRLGAYYARWICKNFVAAKICEFLELELIFGYGKENPIFLIRSKKSKYTDDQLYDCISHVFNFSFEELYLRFNKKGIKYSQLAKYGHFRNAEMPWEQLDMVPKIEKYFHGNS